ncbi:MAG TPA: hypothetical protein VIK86_07430, partial [Candidatus Paceibacterota bacterium]
MNDEYLYSKKDLIIISEWLYNHDLVLDGNKDSISYEEGTITFWDCEAKERYELDNTHEWMNDNIDFILQNCENEDAIYDKYIKDQLVFDDFDE